MTRAVAVLLPFLMLAAYAADTANDRPLSDVEWHREYQNGQFRQGLRSAAALEYQELLRDNPESAYAHLHYARALEPREHYAEAVMHIQKAVELAPDAFWPRYSLGSFYLAASRLELALEQLQKAVQLKPESPEAHYNLAYAHYLKGQYRDCREHLNVALQLRPGYAAAEDLMAQLQRIPGATPNTQIWFIAIAAILVLIVFNFALLRRKYREYEKENDAFEFARRSIRRGRRSPGTRRTRRE